MTDVRAVFERIFAEHRALARQQVTGLYLEQLPVGLQRQPSSLLSRSLAPRRRTPDYAPALQTSGEAALWSSTT